MADVVYPFKKYNYKVKFGDLGIASFSEISAGEISSDAIDYRTGDYTKNTTMKFNGLIKYGNVTFKNGMTSNTDLFKWIEKLDTGAVKPLNIEITLLADDRKTQQAGWTIENAIPVKYSLPDLKGESNEVAFESLEVACDNIKRTK